MSAETRLTPRPAKFCFWFRLCTHSTPAESSLFTGIHPEAVRSLHRKFGDATERIGRIELPSLVWKTKALTIELYPHSDNLSYLGTKELFHVVLALVTGFEPACILQREVNSFLDRQLSNTRIRFVNITLFTTMDLHHNLIVK